jgi:hypothetical protein
MCCLNIAETAPELHNQVAKLEAAFDAQHQLNRARRIRNKLVGANFINLLARFRSRKSSDIRNKVYGMLGLAVGLYADIIEVNYELSPEDVFTTVTLECIKRSGKLTPFSHLVGKRNLDLRYKIRYIGRSFSKKGGCEMHNLR